MMMMKSVFWWRKPEYPEETTDLRQVTDETYHTYGLCPVQGDDVERGGSQVPFCMGSVLAQSPANSTGETAQFIIIISPLHMTLLLRRNKLNTQAGKKHNWQKT